MLLLILSLLYRCPAEGKVYIDIDSPSFQKFPIAIADFKPLQPGAETGDLPVWFADTLSRDLLITGYFNVIDRRAFLEDTSRAGITGEGTRFADWTTIGAEYLIKGGFQTDGRQLITEFRLFDVVKGELIVGKRYVGTTDDKNRMVMQFANEVLQALTGEAGLFDTRIAFVKKSGVTSGSLYDQFRRFRPASDHELQLADPIAALVSRRPAAGLHLLQGRQSGHLSARPCRRRRRKRSFPIRGLNLPGSWSRDSCAAPGHGEPGWKSGDL